MAENRENYGSADGKISVKGRQPNKLDARKLLDGMTKDVKRRWLLVGGAGVVAISVTAAYVSDGGYTPTARAPTHQVIDTTPKGINAQKDWRAQAGAEIQNLQQNLADQKRDQKEMLARLEALRHELAKVKSGAGQPGAPAAPGTASIPNRIEFNIPAPPAPPASLTNNPAAVPAPPPAANANRDARTDRVTVPQETGGSGERGGAARRPARSFIPATAEAAENEKTRVTEDLTLNERRGFLPAASFAGATLISGVEAFTGGTAQAQPQPLVIRIDENAILPNAAQYQIKGCHVLASVYGDLSSERVFGRLATLTCVDTHDKLVLSEEVEGNLIDSDGKNGIRGALQDRQGAKLARSLLAGFAQGMASAFGQAQTSVTSSALGAITSTINPKKSLSTAGYSGANQAAQQLADFYLKQAEATMPVIAVDAGRKVSVLFTKSQSLKFETTDGYKVKQKPTLKAERIID